MFPSLSLVSELPSCSRIGGRPSYSILEAFIREDNVSSRFRRATFKAVRLTLAWARVPAEGKSSLPGAAAFVLPRGCATILPSPNQSGGSLYDADRRVHSK